MLLTPKKIESMNAILESECPVCQCRMIVPTAIPACGHKFCFTCLKGVCMNDMGCPMCRGPIDASIFNLPSQVLDLKMDVPNSPTVEISKNTMRVPKQTCTPASLDLNVKVIEDSHSMHQFHNPLPSEYALM
uniref:RING-type domain-containing protein n=1 Tax=Caenorhabditis tropicalis TaxID=1561998 RepID=A0A1I7TX06_9PELO